MLILVFPACSNGLPLTEGQSLELGLQRKDFQQSLFSRIEVAHGELIGTETWTNPEFELSREEVGGETETGIWLRQSLDLSGRRGLNRDAAQSALSAVKAEINTSRIERAFIIRQHFFQTLHHQQLQELLDHWVEKFRKVEAAMQMREKSGDVSGYDRRRISQEKVSLLARQREVKANYEAAWLKLVGIVELNESLGFDSVKGELIPGVMPPIAEIFDKLKNLPALMQLQHQSEAKRLASRALARSYVPELTLGLGQKWLEGPEGSDHGLMLSASVSLPIFDRKQGAYQRAAAEVQQVESEYRLALSRIETDTHSLWQLADQLADNARLFQQQSVATSYELVRIAETAYRNNEMGVLELIDAYRSAMESEITALKLALESRMKRIELDKSIVGDLP